MRAWAVIGLLAAAPAFATVRFSLVAGSNVGLPEDRVLRWAEADARRMHQLFIELGGVDEKRATLLEAVTTRTWELAFARLGGEVSEARRRGERTEVFVYYSGHGDETALHVGDERLPRATLEAWLKALPADVVLTVIDACRAGRLRSGTSRGLKHTPAFDVRFARQAGPSGRVIIESAGADEVAQESDDLEGGFFTHQLLTGLRGAADADRDRQVSIAEAYRYTYHRTLSSSFGGAEATQHPSIDVDLEGEGELVLTSLQRAGAQLVLEPDVSGELLVIEDSTARVIAELHHGGGAPLELALPVGEYRLLRREGTQVWAGRVTLTWARTQRLTAAGLKEQPRTATLQRGSRFDPSPWRIWVAGAVGVPRALRAGVSAGGRVGVERRLEGPLFLALRAGVGGASARAQAYDHRHTELSIGPAFGVAFSSGLFRVAVALSVELATVFASARHLMADRLDGAGLTPVDGQGWTWGPALGADGFIALTLPLGFELRLGGGVSVGWLKVDGQVRDSLSPFAALAVAYAL